MIDTHCHLTFPDFGGRLPDELDACEQHGVSGVITISTTSCDCLDALHIARSDPRVWCSSGVHPLYSDRGPHAWDAITSCAADDRCVAWGELGLDNHYDRPPKALQRSVLDEQLAVIESCRSPQDESGLGKPIIVHCREAFDDLIPILRASAFEGDRFVFHCFTGNEDDARAVLDLGAMISLTGVATYKNARDVQRAAKMIPSDRLMVETDAPFLSPAPHRGERPCRPWMASVTACFLADLRGEPIESFHDATDRNVSRFFGIPAGGPSS
ncbi:MAG: TatD family hydrolase [Planctomycetota bacterium]